MKGPISIPLFALLILSASSVAQSAAQLPNAPSSRIAPTASGDVTGNAQQAADAPSSPASTDSSSAQPSRANTNRFRLNQKFGYYMTETYLNPGALTAPAVRAGIRMAKPPGKGATQYPPEWRQGAEAFGRNYGDAIAERVSFQTARFVTGAMMREDPRYMPSGSQNVFGRSVHALGFSFIDHSDSGHPMPAFSNFVGAAAGGFVGNAYLPVGFTDVTHAGQRAALQFGFFAAGNLFREFAPQMPRPVRTFFMLVAR